jgi:hypothetical protein
MKNIIKRTLKIVLPEALKKLIVLQKQKKQLKEWQNNGCPVPPPHFIKQNVIKEYRIKYGYGTLIETGTYLGDMVEAQKKIFDKVISIELGYELFKKAEKRFKNDKNVKIIHGDSGKILSEVMCSIDEPVIFWLDGHYSSGITARGDKDCPIFEELDSIFNDAEHKHIILIDDARLFVGQWDYPTIDVLKDFISSKSVEYDIEVKADIIRCIPRSKSLTYPYQEN